MLGEITETLREVSHTGEDNNSSFPQANGSQLREREKGVGGQGQEEKLFISLPQQRALWENT